MLKRRQRSSTAPLDERGPEKLEATDEEDLNTPPITRR